jgi:2-polyprenyl-3-methyl-5-hydroxy-6-metoxy-1,4-benzoquinol methylase
VNSKGSGSPRTLCLLCESVGEPLFVGLQDRICGTPGSFTLRECRSCGLAWLEQEPAEEPHGAGYYTHATDAAALAQQVDAPPLVMGALQSRLGYNKDERTGAAARLLALLPPWREHCESLALFLPARPGGRLLDIGCGSGIFAARMRSLGWELTCVEPDDNAAAVARSAFGLAVHTGTVESAALPAASFDAITLGHVIEHVADPVATLAECRRLLRRDGLLVAITPNIRSLGRRMFGRHWMHWDVPRHRYLFSTESLAEVTRRAGLQAVQLRTSARAARWSWRRSRQLVRQPIVTDDSPGSSRGPGAIAFELAESTLTPWVAAGEECLLLATVQPS